MAAPTSQASSDAADLATVHGWLRAANYVSVGQVYLMDNPLLREPLAPEHIKPWLGSDTGARPLA